MGSEFEHNKKKRCVSCNFVITTFFFSFYWKVSRKFSKRHKLCTYVDTHIVIYENKTKNYSIVMDL